MHCQHATLPLRPVFRCTHVCRRRSVIARPVTWRTAAAALIKHSFSKQYGIPNSRTFLQKPATVLAAAGELGGTAGAATLQEVPALKEWAVTCAALSAGQQRVKAAPVSTSLLYRCRGCCRPCHRSLCTPRSLELEVHLYFLTTRVSGSVHILFRSYMNTQPPQASRQSNVGGRSE